MQGKHPGALSQPARPWWGEIWEFLVPIFDQVRAGETTYFENQLMLPNRLGFVEEVYFTFSHSPLYNEVGQVAGILALAIDTTTTIVGQRRLAMLSHLTFSTTAATTPETALHQVAESLATNPHDVPFALLYRLETASAGAALLAQTGLPAAAPLAPTPLGLADSPAAGWPLAEVAHTGAPVLVPDLAAHFGAVPAGDWPAAPTQALVLPIAYTGQEAGQAC